ncbi:MAG: hypothetical protein ACOYJQ_17110 [Pseudochelatococcus sp.]|jgi:hypothetical protein|uniref:hypothetical protein n=1 Tax=Pseudochelatococcus sp. TaxID=2020869 RepID=UPI003D92DD23
MAVVIYFMLCVLVGILGLGYWGGFLLYFILALAMTPLVALLVLIIVGSSEGRRGFARFRKPEP